MPPRLLMFYGKTRLAAYAAARLTLWMDGMISRAVFSITMLLAAAPCALAQTTAINTVTQLVPDAAGASASGEVYTEETPIERIAADPAGAAVLNKDIPGLLTDKSYDMFKGMNLKTIQRLSGGDLSEDTVKTAAADLKALPSH